MKKYLPFLFLGLFFFAFPAHAAITFNSSSTKAFTATLTPTSSIVVGSGANAVLMICIGTGAAGDNITEVSVSSTAMGSGFATFVASTSAGTRPAFLYSWIASNTVAGTVNVSGTISTSIKGSIGLSDFFGVQQSYPTDQTNTLVSNTTNPSLSIPILLNNQWGDDCLSAAQNTGFTPAAGQASTSIQTSQTPGLAASYDNSTAAGTGETMGWTNLGGSVMSDYDMTSLVPAITQTTTIALLATSTATSSGSNVALSFAAQAATNGILFAWTDNLSATSTGVTANGTAMTLVANQGKGNAALYYLLNPPAGTYEVTSTFSTTGSASLAVSLYQGVNQTSPFDATSSIIDSGFSVNSLEYFSSGVTTTQNNDMGVDFVQGNNLAGSPGAFYSPAYQTNNYLNVVSNFAQGSSDEAGQSNTSTIQFGWLGLEGPINWMGVALEEAPSSTPSVNLAASPVTIGGACTIGKNGNVTIQ